MEILNTESILRYFMGLSYLKNKSRYRNRQEHIHTDLKWSSQHESGLEMRRLAQTPPERPVGATGGPCRPFRV